MNVESILLKRGYKPQQAKSVSVSLQKIDNTLKPLLENWLSYEKEIDYNVNGISISFLMQKFKMLYPAALLTLDWLIREPEKATNAINRGIR